MQTEHPLNLQYPPDAVLCLLQKRVVSVHPPRSGQSRTAMVDGSSQADEAGTAEAETSLLPFKALICNLTQMQGM